MRRRHHWQSPRGEQRGVVLLITLIVLVVLLIAGVALMRSFDTTLTSAGNLAFKRDMAQQSEQVVEKVMALFRPGAASSSLYDSTTRQNSQPTLNYSAAMLSSNPQGIPLVLLDDSSFPTVASASNDVSANGSITLRYVVDRLCTVTGDEKALGTAQCKVADSVIPPGGSISDPQRPESSSSGGPGALIQPVIYRITVRASGPRDSMSFFQATFSCCDN